MGWQIGTCISFGSDCALIDTVKILQVGEGDELVGAEAVRLIGTSCAEALAAANATETQAARTSETGTGLC